MPTINAIANYWIENSDISELDLMFDWADAEHHCWNCGLETTRLEKCHIIPRMLKGDNKNPSNYILMCHQCHSEAPNLRSTNAMWNWIKDNKKKGGVFGGFSTTFKIGMAIERFGNDKFINLYTKHGDKLLNLLKEKIKNDVGLHKTNITHSTYDYLLLEIEEKLKS